MRAIAGVLCTLVLAGCFPHNERAQKYSKWGEGAALIAGIALEAVNNTGADCDAMSGTANTGASSCKSQSTAFGTVGLVLIVGGLLGFVATVSTAEDGAKPEPIKQEVAKPPVAVGTYKLPPGVVAPTSSAQ